MTARILLADDHPLLRRGLRQVIDNEPDLEVVAEASDGAEAVEKAIREAVDLAILDVAMPRLTGLQAAEQLARRRPETKTLILSMHDSDQYLFAAARAGARGYIMKAFADEEIVQACRAAMRNGPFVTPAGTSARARTQIERLVCGQPAEDELLSPRELEVLKLVAEGRSSLQIAQALVISVKTVDRHRANIIEKLGIRDVSGLTRYAIRRGLVEL